MGGSTSANGLSKKDSSFQFPPLDTKSKGGLVVLAVIGAVGGVFICLGAMNFFGPTGSLNFIATISGGGVAILIAAGGITYIVVKKKKPSADGSGTVGGAQQSSKARSHGVHTFAAPSTSRVKPYSALAKRAIAWALKETKPDTPSAQLPGHQPTDPRLAKLVTLYNGAYDELRAALRKYPNDPWHRADALAIVQEVRNRKIPGKNSTYNPWNNPEAVAEVEKRVAALTNWNPKDDPWAQSAVCRAAQRMIAFGFAISALTLDDLPNFTSRMSNKKSFAESLTRQTGYMYETFFKLPIAYNYMRARWVCTDAEANEGSGRFETLPCEYPTQALLNELTTEEGTFNDMYLLYNEFSDRVRQYTTEQELEAADNGSDRYTFASKKDDGKADFDTRLNIPS